MNENLKSIKIPLAEFEKGSIASLATRPTRPSAFGNSSLSVEDVKKWFDKNPKLLTERLNALIDYLPLLAQDITLNLTKEGGSSITLSELAASITATNGLRLQDILKVDYGADKKTLAEVIGAFIRWKSESEDDRENNIATKIKAEMDPLRYVLKIALYNELESEISSAEIDFPLETLISSVTVSEDGDTLTLSLTTGQSVSVDVSKIVRGLTTDEGLTAALNSLEGRIGQKIDTSNSEISGLKTTKQDRLSFDEEYNPTSNKAATVRTVINKMAEIVANSPADYDTLKKIADYIASDKIGAAEINNKLSQHTKQIAGIIGESSKGLEYRLSDNGKYYICTGIGTCTDKDVIIPDEYEGLPVKEIGMNAFATAEVESITLPRYLNTAWGGSLSSPTIKKVVVEIEESAYESSGSEMLGRYGWYTLDEKTIDNAGASPFVTAVIGPHPYYEEALEWYPPFTVENLTDTNTMLEEIYLPWSVEHPNNNYSPWGLENASIFYDIRFSIPLETRVISLEAKIGVKEVVNITSIDETYENKADLPWHAEDGTCLIVTSEQAIYRYSVDRWDWVLIDRLRAHTLYCVLSGQKSGIYRYTMSRPYLVLAEQAVIEEANRYTDERVGSIESAVNKIIGESSKGLEYRLSDNGKYYICTGIGTCTDKDVIIPDEVDGIQVREIGMNAFATAEVESITLPHYLLTAWGGSLSSPTIKKVVVRVYEESYQYYGNETLASMSTYNYNGQLVHNNGASPFVTAVIAPHPYYEEASDWYPPFTVENLYDTQITLEELHLPWTSDPDFNMNSHVPWGLENASIFYDVTMPESIEKRLESVESQIGDIDTALDSIIAIQESLIGGDTE